MKRSIFLVIFLITGIICPLQIAAAEFPTKEIELWVGMGAGGSGDVPARMLAETASKTLGQPIVVLNKPGGGGAVMLGELKNRKPDGYTIGGLFSGGLLSALMRTVSYHPVNDFDCILQYQVFQFGFVVRTDSPWKTLKDLIAYAKANPNKLKYSTAGMGTPQHLLMIQFGELLNVKWVHVPFGSGMEATTALLGGHVDFSAQSPEWKTHVDSGRLRLLAVPMDKRMDSYPDVPTLRELGYDVTASSFAGLVAPKGVPKNRMRILHDALRKSLQDPKFNSILKRFDLLPLYRNSEECNEYLKEFYEKSRKLIEKYK